MAEDQAWRVAVRRGDSSRSFTHSSHSTMLRAYNVAVDLSRDVEDDISAMRDVTEVRVERDGRNGWELNEVVWERSPRRRYA
jgi:hypothetical protein